VGGVAGERKSKGRDAEPEEGITWGLLREKSSFLGGIHRRKCQLESISRRCYSILLFATFLLVVLHHQASILASLDLSPASPHP